MGKIEAVLKILHEGDAIFWFDADVFINKHPYKAMKVSNTNLKFYIQAEGWQPNFGVFLAYPDTFTTGIFEYMKVEFEGKLQFDQDILKYYLKTHKNTIVNDKTNVTDIIDCNGICGDPYDYEFLPKYDYINLMTGVYHYNSRGNHVLAHATCVEGMVLPEIVMTSMFGSPHQEYYMKQKTVSVNYDFFLPTDKEKVDRSMQTLVYFAKKTGRSIRVVSKYSNHVIFCLNSFRIISPDYVTGKLGVQIVEDKYFVRAHNWFGRSLPIVVNVTLGDPNVSLSNLQGLASEQSTIEGLSKEELMLADEVVFNLTELLLLDEHAVGKLAGEQLGYINGSWSRPFNCYNIEKEIAGCTAICDGGHF
eukprot:CAMPEP_0172521322 /NCGR_PEP_ID=MMETSP1066-20121228/292517_1 /TAXON_ID=671091 /ORGANISM="Coscinodiscus wailesii, Strain CCMP2513" /LENGTH=361 /DNA_ID=CAMNT_0013304223 /DNA_START=855 /DNA_END=1940 /DNA_ORIENTATION=+